MAKGMKTGGRNFQKGQSGNPKGFTPIPEDIKTARKLTRIEFERITNQYLFLTKEELGALTRNPKTPVIELLVASIVHQAVMKGDEKRLEFILSRLVGKVKEELNVTGIESAPQVIVYLPSNGSEAKS